MGQESLVWDLLGSGAQVNAVDKDGCTPLMWAARKGFAEVFALLLAVGGDPTIVDKAYHPSFPSIFILFHL